MVHLGPLWRYGEIISGFIRTGSFILKCHISNSGNCLNLCQPQFLLLYNECWGICMWVRKKQLELDMEQQTGSKLGKEYVKALYCHPAYLTYMQSTSWETLGCKKQGDNIWPWLTAFPIWNQSVVPCPVLTLASWPAYRFIKRQVRWSAIPISFRIFHSLLWSTQSKALA